LPAICPPIFTLTLPSTLQCGRFAVVYGIVTSLFSAAAEVRNP
jgi:hypothetical protein